MEVQRMAKAAPAALAVQAVVFSFDPDPGTSPTRALHVLTTKGGLPGADLERGERFVDAAQRAVAEAGVQLGGRRGRGAGLQLAGIDDEPGRGNRTVTAWYMATAPYEEASGPAKWSSVGRGLRLDAGAGNALKAATERLRSETRTVAGAAALLGDVFTGDDLLRLHIALHGGPRSSERTFRRRVQELRDAGILRSVPEREVTALRQRNARFRSPAGTGGRPPELLRYSGSGGEDEQLAGLRARRSS
jgi:ADP-ribose pyrophosphatase YjhB (NUDIX family)